MDVLSQYQQLTETAVPEAELPQAEIDRPTWFFQESDHPFAELYRERVEQNRDLVVLITDSDNDRGTGKTTEALRLAQGMDRTEEGLTDDKVTLDARPLVRRYTDKPRGSGLVLDESEIGVDKYRSGSSVNRAIRELVATGRIEQKYTVLNAPGDHLIDKDLKSLVDVWILVERRGFANVYRMGWAPHQGHELTHGLGTIEWDPIKKGTQLHEVYKSITRDKEARLRGEDDGEKFVKREEAQDMVKQAKNKTEKELRREYAARMDELGLTQSEIGEVIGLSQSSVSKMLNS